MLPKYHSYLLRLWQAGPADNPSWRASLEDPHTHQLIGFDSIDALYDHLKAIQRELAVQTNPPQNATRRSL
jgi:hypothetical protein